MDAKVLNYRVIVQKEDGLFVAYVPTLGISDFGKSLDGALKNVQGAILCHIEGLIKTQTEVPEPDNQEYFVGNSTVSVSGSVKFAV